MTSPKKKSPVKKAAKKSVAVVSQAAKKKPAKKNSATKKPVKKPAAKKIARAAPAKPKVSSPKLAVVSKQSQVTPAVGTNALWRLLEAKKSQAKERAQVPAHSHDSTKEQQDQHRIRFAKFAGPRRRAS